MIIRSTHGITYRALLCLAMHFILFMLYLTSISQQPKRETLWLALIYSWKKLSLREVK